MRRKCGLLLIAALLVVTAGCATNDFSAETRLALKNELNLSCETKEQCWETVLAANPKEPKFAIAVPPNFGIAFAQLARERFGSKVLITRWDGYFITRSQAINPAFAQALKYDPFIIEIAPSDPAVEQLMTAKEKTLPVPLEVRARTSFVERTFSAQPSVSRDLLHPGLIRALKDLSPQIFDWMEREVRQQEKARAKPLPQN